jgi:2-succinyl-6-hydroxy-2,4-cyclohexadiene-1-carboxylate synthase
MAETSAHRLIFVHGFTQTHHHWHACADLIGRRLTPTPTLAFVDLPGHGLSCSDRTAIGDGAALASAGGRGTYIGYSLGARWALAAVAAGVSEIERLVLIGGTAGIAEPDARHQRIATDEALAVRVRSLGVEAFVDEWMSAPMFAELPADPDDVRHRYSNSAEGLASSLLRAGAGAMPPVWDRLESITIPVLVMAGARDTKFATIAESLAELLRDASIALVPGAGHAAHLEQPSRTAELISDWLAGLHR